MPLWSQHLLVALAVLGCCAFIARSAWRALRGKRSGLAGCGTCGGCQPTNNAAAKSTAAPQEKVVFLPADMLATRSSARAATKHP